jgi:hypothetical protein
MTAGEMQKYFEAGLIIVGREDGEYQWLGTKQEWQRVEKDI